MFIGNVLDKNTKISDWLLMLYFFLNGIMSRAFQNDWYPPLREIYESRFIEVDFREDTACLDCGEDTVFMPPEPKVKSKDQAKIKPSTESDSNPKTKNNPSNKISPTQVVDSTAVPKPK